eukprot:1962906-Pleurochrysis_carterae.AAC.1
MCNPCQRAPTHARLCVLVSIALNAHEHVPLTPLLQSTKRVCFVRALDACACEKKETKTEAFSWRGPKTLRPFFHNGVTSPSPRSVASRPPPPLRAARRCTCRSRTATTRWPTPARWARACARVRV